MVRLLVATLALVAGTTARAEPQEEGDPWGVGPSIGTLFIPGHLPMRFPEEVRDDMVQGEPSLERVRGDVQVGVDGVYYAGDAFRLGALAGLGLGSDYFDAHLILHYDQAVASFEAMDVTAGVGVGIGSTTWTGAREARLAVPYYPVRVQVGSIFHQDWTAVQGSLFAQYNLPSNHYFRDSRGNDVDTGGGMYLAFGAELTVYFGRLDW